MDSTTSLRWEGSRKEKIVAEGLCRIIDGVSTSGSNQSISSLICVGVQSDWDDLLNRLWRTGWHLCCRIHLHVLSLSTSNAMLVWREWFCGFVTVSGFPQKLAKVLGLDRRRIEWMWMCNECGWLCGMVSPGSPFLLPLFSDFVSANLFWAGLLWPSVSSSGTSNALPPDASFDGGFAASLCLSIHNVTAYFCALSATPELHDLFYSTAGTETALSQLVCNVRLQTASSFLVLHASILLESFRSPHLCTTI
jgi:hypothetical protein